MIGTSLGYKDIVERVSKAFLEHQSPAFTYMNLETHLEDINILVEANVDFKLPQEHLPVVQVCEHLANFFNELGYERSYLIMNALRFKFNVRELFDMVITVPQWLTLMRSIVGTVNTTMRYKEGTTCTMDWS